MMTIEQALALTPGGFKLFYFIADMDTAYYRDRNGNEIHKVRGIYYAQYNGNWSGNLDSLESAQAWINDKKKWWGK